MRARKASSCIDRLAWGPLGSRRCMSCWVWRNKHPGERACTGCGRILAVKDGYCQLCWQQARYQSRIAGGMPRGAVSVLNGGGRLPWHQLFFDRMQLRRPEGPVRQHGRRGAPVKLPPVPAGRPAFRWVQPRLFEAWRDFTRFNEDADLASDIPVRLGDAVTGIDRRGVSLLAEAILRASGEPKGHGAPAW
jgi:hypothetical protein